MAVIPFYQRLTCSVQEACEATGLSKTSIAGLIADGTLESTKVCGRRLVSVASLAKLVDAKSQQPAA